MTDSPNPLAPHHLPWFITAPGETDGLFVGMMVFLIVVILALGNLYFQLHALPERVAHRANRFQMEIVAVLGLLALFTHNNLFWIAALLLALVQFPDFSTPINSMADSLEKLVRRGRPALPEPELGTELVLEAAYKSTPAPARAAGPATEGSSDAASEPGEKPAPERS